MSWNIERILFKQFSSPKDLIFDGRFIIVLDNIGIHFIDYRDQLNDSENNLLGDTNFELDIFKTISVNPNNTQLQYYNNHYYVSDNIQLTKIELNKGIIEQIQLPEEINSNLAHINGRLWFSSLNRNVYDEQLLYSYDGTEFVKTSIPTRHQNEPRYISGDFNNNVLVTNFNDVSVSKFNSDTNQHISNIRLSREPYFIKTLSDRTCLVASTVSIADPDPNYNRVKFDNSIVDSSFDSGILYAVDTINDTQQTNFQTLGKITGLTDSSGKYWMTTKRILDNTESITRLDLSTNQLKFTKSYEIKPVANEPSPAPFNWNIEETKMKEDSYKKSVKCDSYVYPKWDGSSIINETVPLMMFFITDNYLQGFKIDSLYTTQFSSVYSTAMISWGNHDYTGD